MKLFRVSLVEHNSWDCFVKAETAEEAKKYVFENRGTDPSIDMENNTDTAECTYFDIFGTEIEEDCVD